MHGTIILKNLTTFAKLLSMPYAILISNDNEIINLLFLYQLSAPMQEVYMYTRER